MDNHTEHKEEHPINHTSQPDYSGVMKLYKQLEQKGFKAEADKVMGDISSHYSADNPAPAKLIQSELEKILHSTDNNYVGIAAKMMAVGLGFAINPVVGVGALAYFLYNEYQKNQSHNEPKPAH